MIPVLIFNRSLFPGAKRFSLTNYYSVWLRLGVLDNFGTIRELPEKRLGVFANDLKTMST